jgi:hypothetical protein
MILSTLFCHTAQMRVAHWVRSAVDAHRYGHWRLRCFGVDMASAASVGRARARRTTRHRSACWALSSAAACAPRRPIPSPIRGKAQPRRRWAAGCAGAACPSGAADGPVSASCGGLRRGSARAMVSVSREMFRVPVSYCWLPWQAARGDGRSLSRHRCRGWAYGTDAMCYKCHRGLLMAIGMAWPIGAPGATSVAEQARCAIKIPRGC